MKIALIVPHIFINKDILKHVIFSPGTLALDLAHGLQELRHEVTLFTPGAADTKVRNITGDLAGFDEELAERGYGYVELLKKHPLTFISMSRAIQSQIISLAIQMANDGEFDVVHFYTNEEEIAMAFAKLCKVPTLFTHHDPFDYLARYRSNFYKYKHLNWVSISYSQRKGMPLDTNWVGNVYHGIPPVSNFQFPSRTYSGTNFQNVERKTQNVKPYLAYLGRIIEPKGVHLAIAAVKKAGVKLKIAGKYYDDDVRKSYWANKVLPELNSDIEYVGFISDEAEKAEFLKNAKALIVPSTFEEPFGMVMIEALSVGTPIIGLDNGAIPEIVKDGENGFLVKTVRTRDENNNLIVDEDMTIDNLVGAIGKSIRIESENCIDDFEKRFSLARMVREYEEVYKKLTKK